MKINQYNISQWWNEGKIYITISKMLQRHLKKIQHPFMIKNKHSIIQEEENFLMEYMKNPLVIQSSDQEDPLEKRTATHSSILAWRIPWTEEPGRLQSMGLQRVRHSWVTNPHSQHHTTGGRLEAFILLKSGTRQGCLFHHFHSTLINNF